MKLLLPLLLCSLANAVQLDVSSTDSIRNASATLAFSLMSYYKNNQSTTPAAQIGVIQVPPLYWWESAACWGGMIDYWAYTRDESYVQTTAQAILAQIGPKRNFEPPAFFYSLGNDDVAFWAATVLSAAEYEFPVPSGQPSSLWTDLAANIFNTLIGRWDDTTCGGGVRWQVFSNRGGYSYKNSISNAGLLQMSARLARYTGNQTYADWTEKIWNWMSSVRLIDDQYSVFDGTDSAAHCATVDHTVWSYNPAMLLYGSAIMYNYTNASKTWEDRTTGLLSSIVNTLTSPYPNATDIMYEAACEPKRTCNYDQLSFKAYLARWMAKSAIVAPYIKSNVETILAASAKAAAQSCSGGPSGTECGIRWYVDGFDGAIPGLPSVGQALSGLETIQALLLLRGDAAHTFPIASSHVHIEQAPQSTSTTPHGTSTTSHGTSATPPKTTATPPSTAAIPPSAATIPPSTAALPPSTVPVPPGTVAVPPSTVAVPPSTVAVPPGTVTINDRPSGSISNTTPSSAGTNLNGDARMISFMACIPALSAIIIGVTSYRNLGRFECGSSS